MECDRAGDLMMLYMDKALPEDEAKLLNQHLRSCDSCKEDFYAYDKILSELSIQKVYSPPEGFEDAVMEKIRSLDFKRPLVANRDSLVCIIWGVFSILFGIGFLATMYKEAIIDYLSSSGNLSGFVQTLAPISEYAIGLSTDLNLAVTAFGANLAGMVSPFRYVLLSVFFVLAGVQYFIHRKNKVEI